MDKDGGQDANCSDLDISRSRPVLARLRYAPPKAATLLRTSLCSRCGRDHGRALFGPTLTYLRRRDSAQ
jgi:hypothetical protein